MRIAGWLMLPGVTEQSGGCVRLSSGVVRVVDGVIAEVAEGEVAGDCELGGEGFVVLPGLIDAHMHLPQMGIIGAYGLGLLDWLSRVTFPAELAWADAEHARTQAQSAIHRMLACGTTGFAAYATVHHDATLAALEIARTLGVRAHIGQVLMDRGAPELLCRPANQLVDESAALLKRYPPGQRVSAAVCPRFAPSCSARLLAQAGQLAQEHDALIQTHLAETVDECRLVGQLFDGASYTQVYHEAGLLNKRSVLGHGIYLSDHELAMLAQTGSVIAHCPTANSFLQSGRLNRERVRVAGVKLALGSDLGAGFEVSMVRVARAMVETAGAVAMDARGRGTIQEANDASKHHPGVGAAQAWHAITAGNADALGWPDGGRIAVGCPADLVVVKPGVPLRAGTAVDPLSAMLFGWDDRWVRATLLRGKVAYANAGQGRAGEAE